MHDVVIIGGSFAGLAAAMQLGRARRDVLVIDAGERRNRFTSHAHGFIGQDGQDPGAIAAKAKAEVLRYPSVRWLDGSATTARVVPGGFSVNVDGNAHPAKKLILATGVVDDLPEIPGLRERWGKGVYPCPYCDGYELNRGRLGVLAAGPHAAHYAALVADWGAPGETTLFLDVEAEANAARSELAPRRIRVEGSRIVQVAGVERRIEIAVENGERYELAGLFLAPRTRLSGTFASDLGCDLELGPAGPVYKTDPRTKETTVPGVYACGDTANPQASVTFAVGDGARAGISAHQALVFG